MHINLCASVCVSVFNDGKVCTYIHTYIKTYYIYTYIHTHIYLSMCIDAHKLCVGERSWCYSAVVDKAKSVYASIHICMCIHVYIYMHTYEYIHICVYMHIHLCACVYVNAHTRERGFACVLFWGGVYGCIYTVYVYGVCIKLAVFTCVKVHPFIYI